MSLEVEVGHVYRAKKPSNSRGFVNDRQVVWTNGVEVQYDGPAVGMGRHYPRVSKDQFLAWAGCDVTESMPKGEWMSWEDRKKAA